jgi:hypothetical protein
LTIDELRDSIIEGLHGYREWRKGERSEKSGKGFRRESPDT